MVYTLRPVSTLAASSVTDSVAVRLPKVFIVPLPDEFNSALLDCSADLPCQVPWLEQGLNHGRTWRRCQRRNMSGYFHGDGVDHGITAQQPFGPPVTTPSLTYTPEHPSIEQGEYDLDVYFHTMMRGYAGLVSDPSEADLFYVPSYHYWRLPCHPQANSSASFAALERRLADSIGTWIRAHPPRTGAHGPNFFTVVGMLCSCTASHCNPLQSRPDLDGSLRLFSYDTLPRGRTPSVNAVTPRGRVSTPDDEQLLRPFRLARGVVPYVSQLHGVQTWPTHLVVRARAQTDRAAVCPHSLRPSRGGVLKEFCRVFDRRGPSRIS